MAADETRVDAADVMALFGSYDDPAELVAWLREAAGGGWVCIAPDGTLHRSSVYADDGWLHVRPVEAP